MPSFEIYKATESRGRRATYLVFANEKNIYTEGAKAAKHYFKCREEQLCLLGVWVKGDEMFFFDHPQGSKRAFAYCCNWKRRLSNE